VCITSRELFPGEGGWHRQRAFRDALCDLLPPAYGYLPTLRIGEFEVISWLHERSTKERLRSLLMQRGISRSIGASEY
jgi:hypothetical protein